MDDAGCELEITVLRPVEERREEHKRERERERERNCNKKYLKLRLEEKKMR